MRFEMTPDEARFLDAQLVRHIETMENELVHTDKHRVQHELATEVSTLKRRHERLAHELAMGGRA